MSAAAIERWRAACDAATQAEFAYFDAALRSMDGSVPHPPTEERERAKQLRAEAQRLFFIAMDDVAQRAEAAAGLVASTRRDPVP